MGMQFSHDKHGSKFLFIWLFIVVLYLGMFNFDIVAAYHYTVAGVIDFFKGF